MARLALGPLASWHMCFGLSRKPVGFQETAGGIWFPPYQVHPVPEEASCLPHHVSASLNLSCTNQRPSYNTELKGPLQFASQSLSQKGSQKLDSTRLGSALHT